ncbi:hypothetical protein ACFWFI_28545 [Streptomyces sp. NPDC060209]|uniref:hypothetical protein n=1 Tax=Streptomyces sp. NPDC060209 TaxID=3347073 RepID=UPI0036699968
MTSERIASHLASVFFTARINGSWRRPSTPAPDHQAPAALARDHLRRKAEHAVRPYSVLDVGAAQDAANAALAHWGRVSGLEATGAVELHVTAHDRGLAEEHARRQQAADLDHEENLYRLAQLQRVLANPDLRRVWWIARFPDRFNDIQGLTAALENLPQPHEPMDDDLRGDVRRFTDQLFTDLHTPQQREVFLQAFVQTLNILGQHDLQATAAQWLAPEAPGSQPT